VDPINEPAVVTNAMVNFGYEYVWHCHLLGHEENDMMRPMTLATPPETPKNVAASAIKQTVTLVWTNAAKNATTFTIQRASSAAGPWSTVGVVPATQLTFINAGLAKKTTYFYRVIANNVIGYTQSYPAPTVGYPHLSFDSLPTAPVSITTA
jgi:hypothetical protein